MLFEQDSHLWVAQVKKRRLEVIIRDVCLLLNLLDCEHIVIIEEIEDDSLTAVGIQNIGCCLSSFLIALVSRQSVLGMDLGVTVLV